VLNAAISHVTSRMMASRRRKFATKGPVNWPD